MTENLPVEVQAVPIAALESAISSALETFTPYSAAISEIGDGFLELRCNGADDKDAFAVVHDARIRVKKVRVGIEKARKEAKEDALVYGRAVDSEARRLRGLLLPIETHLEKEEDEVVQERARIRQEKLDRRQELLDQRVEELSKLGSYLSPAIVDVMSEKAFAVALEEARFDHAAAQVELAMEKAQAKAREKAAEKERAEAQAALDAQKKEQAEEQARLQSERAAVDAKMAELKRIEEAGREKAADEKRKRAGREKPKKKAAGDADDEKRQYAQQFFPDLAARVNDLIDGADGRLTEEDFDFAQDTLRDCAADFYERAREIA